MGGEEEMAGRHPRPATPKRLSQRIESLMKPSLQPSLGTLLFLLLPSSVWAFGVLVPFVGLDQFHFSYSAFYSNASVPDGEPTITQVRLEVRDPNGSTQVLREDPMGPTADIPFEGSQKLEGLDVVGVYSFSIFRKMFYG